jgi:hypothetical protein
MKTTQLRAARDDEGFCTILSHRDESTYEISRNQPATLLPHTPGHGGVFEGSNIRELAELRSAALSLAPPTR